MQKAILFDFLVDKEKNQIHVHRSFNAPIDLVWAAWTEAEILDLWWAPRPYKNETKSMDFRIGGRWHYSMLSPEGERHWCYFDYEQIENQKLYNGKDGFCDENGAPTNLAPGMRWHNQFTNQGDTTLVHVNIRFEKPEDLETIVNMGFKEGFSMGMNQLDEYISAQFYLRKNKKPNNQPRVSSYLNFAGNTEEAMTFYKSVFQSEFVDGIQRFGSIPPDPQSPPISENLKNMVLHVELPILGGSHILMATDAPTEMGFSLTQGNNMHINLEPDTRAEAERIFQALAEGGTISMPLQDMFWGAYFGSLTDRYGINWMVNHQTK